MLVFLPVRVRETVPSALKKAPQTMAIIAKNTNFLAGIAAIDSTR
jgi:hypothetical protein